MLPRGVRRPSCLTQPVPLGSTSSSDNSSPCLSHNVFVCTACPVFPVAHIIQSLLQLLFLSEEEEVQRGEITRAGSDGQDENPSPHFCFSPLALHMSSRRERRQQAPVWRPKPRRPGYTPDHGWLPSLRRRLGSPPARDPSPAITSLLFHVP